MGNDAGAHRRGLRRAISVICLAITTVVAFAAPAFGHPVFSNDPPGFPNPQGSTAIPYPGGSRPTVNMFLPFEQEGVVFNGAENTTVDVKVTIPVGWTSPACGAASTSPSTGYRQVGTMVPGWTCTIDTVNGHQVLHWHGLQVSTSQAYTDSAQFFTFPVTAPSPATQTNYGANGGPEGFYVEQTYADGATSLWRTPNSTRPGEVANGIVRTVAGSTPRNPNLPKETPFDETHLGPNNPKPAPPGVNPTGTKAPAPAPPAARGSNGPTQGGDGPTPPPAGQPSPSGPAAAGDSPSPAAQDSPAPTSTDPPPGTDTQASSAKQLAQQRDDETGHGFGWQVLVGIVVGAALVVGAVIAVVQRRRRSS